MNLKSRTRSYAATGYYLAAKGRSNLSVLTGALVEKILFGKDKTTGIPIANGVLYSVGDETLKVTAKKEVILSAGSIGSPQILELSGIGDRKLLTKLGIDVTVANSNVGENLQDHIYVPIG
jgi:choline dehydrogenase